MPLKERRNHPIAGTCFALVGVNTYHSIFAHGAVQAARWGHGQKPGLYGMTDVLGL